MYLPVLSSENKEKLYQIAIWNANLIDSRQESPEENRYSSKTNLEVITAEPARQKQGD